MIRALPSEVCIRALDFGNSHIWAPEFTRFQQGCKMDLGRISNSHGLGDSSKNSDSYRYPAGTIVFWQVM